MRKLLKTGALILGLATLFSFSCATNGFAEDITIAKPAQYQNYENIDDQIYAWREIVNADNKDFEGFANLTLLYYDKKDYSSSYKSVQRVIKLYEKYEITESDDLLREAMVKGAASAYKLGKLSAAENILTKMLGYDLQGTKENQDTYNGMAYYYLAAINKDMGNYDRSYTYINTAIHFCPSHSIFWDFYDGFFYLHDHWYWRHSHVHYVTYVIPRHHHYHRPVHHHYRPKPRFSPVRHHPIREYRDVHHTRPARSGGMHPDGSSTHRPMPNHHQQPRQDWRPVHKNQPQQGQVQRPMQRPQQRRVQGWRPVRRPQQPQGQVQRPMPGAQQQGQMQRPTPRPQQQGQGWHPVRRPQPQQGQVQRPMPRSQQPQGQIQRPMPRHQQPQGQVQRPQQQRVYKPQPSRQGSYRPAPKSSSSSRSSQEQQHQYGRRR